MQVEHQATSAVRAATRRAQAHLLQARQVVQTKCKEGPHSYLAWLQVKPMVHLKLKLCMGDAADAGNKSWLTTPTSMFSCVLFCQLHLSLSLSWSPGIRCVRLWTGAAGWRAQRCGLQRLHHLLSRTPHRLGRVREACQMMVTQHRWRPAGRTGLCRPNLPWCWIICVRRTITVSSVAVR